MTAGNAERTSRRLAAILVADIAGYAALMGADEDATVRALKGHQAVLLPMIAAHGGHVIDLAGDGILAEFPSVVGAVEAAIAMQAAMADRNTGVPVERRMQFRIGINQGDVVHDEVAYLRRRHQYRGAAAGAGRTGRHLHFRESLRRGARPHRRGVQPTSANRRSRTSSGRCGPIG